MPWIKHLLPDFFLNAGSYKYIFIAQDNPAREALNGYHNIYLHRLVHEIVSEIHGI